MAHHSNSETPVSSALRNELVLNEIFHFLPLKSLLTCSQVNKFWNARARTFIRDHRKCTVSITSPTILPCTQLEQLDQDLARMTIVPFNSLKIKLQPHNEPGPANSHSQPCHRFSHLQNILRSFYNCSYENLITKLKLKYLWICWTPNVVECSVTVLVYWLLTEAATELKSLSLDKISPLCVRMFSARDKLQFPQLEELEIGNVGDWRYNEGMKSFLQRILDGSPNLSNIIHNGSNSILEILPENKYHLVRNFCFDVFNKYNRELLELTGKFVQNGPRISNLTVNCVPEFYVRVRCHPLFQPLVQACSNFLKKLEISCESVIQKILMIPVPLPNVTHLNLGFYSVEPSEFLQEFQQIQLEYLFPKLEEVKLAVRDAGIVGGLPQSEVDRELNNFVPDARHSSLTAMKLGVSMQICSGGLLQLMKTFPYLEHLEISAGYETSHVLPYRDIFRFWPNLRTLVAGGHVHFEHLIQIQNCDADFCGIYQEELELLRDMSAGELEKLQIVPVRPCAPTMKNLITLSIHFIVGDYPHDLQYHGRDPTFGFLSPVAQILLWKRMPGLNFSFSWREAPKHGFPFIFGWTTYNHGPN